MAEHSAVNRRVVGSSPTCGANNSDHKRGHSRRVASIFVYALVSRAGEDYDATNLFFQSLFRPYTSTTRTHNRKNRWLVMEELMKTNHQRNTRVIQIRILIFGRWQ